MWGVSKLLVLTARFGYPALPQMAQFNYNGEIKHVIRVDLFLTSAIWKCEIILKQANEFWYKCAFKELK
jgi:hypothetical protein